MLLIITGCIQVDHDTPYVVIRDTSERLQDYLKTIRWAIEDTDFTEILFGDNSGFPLHTVYEMKQLQELSESAGKYFEYYSFQGDTCAVQLKGKGYGEGEIIAYIYRKSSLMRRAECYYKITGRLTINNIHKIQLSNKAENTFIFDVGMRSVDTRFYKLGMRDYETFFKDAYYAVNDSRNMVLEYVYYSVLATHRLPFRRFNRSLEFRGKSGSSGTEYCEICHENIFTEMVYKSFLYKTYWGRAVLKYVRRIKVPANDHE